MAAVTRLPRNCGKHRHVLKAKFDCQPPQNTEVKNRRADSTARKAQANPW